MKLKNTNMNNKNSEDFEFEQKPAVSEWTMYSPIPESLDWHRLTYFKCIGILAKQNPKVYEDWKKRGLVPAWAIKKENEREHQS